MLDASAIEGLIRLGEDATTEFKGTVRPGTKVDARDLAEAVVSLANTRGGHLLLGVEDNGALAGVGSPKEADELMLQATQVCQAVHPALWCPIYQREVRGALVIVVEVPAFSPGRPYRSTDCRYFVRDASHSREATREELIGIRESSDLHFDEQPVEGATLEDLDRPSVERFLSDADGRADPSTLLRDVLVAIKCLDRLGTPTVAGVLFFATALERWLPDARISAVRFRGTEASQEFLDRKEIGGPLTAQVEGAIGFLERHVPSPSRVEGWERVDQGIPTEVLREALLNAVTHRDYRAASQVRLFVFDDRVELHNPGGLLNRLTLESIREGISQRRNPVVASLLARASRRLEGLGLGVRTMFRLMRERHLPEPELDVEGGHFRVVLRMRPGTGP